MSKVKKDLIESECQGLLDFIESKLTLDDMAGSEAVKAWLREDQKLLEKGALHALPMGYLVAGRIGTGKTYLVQCWAGELGIPCVVFKNFRDRCRRHDRTSINLSVLKYRQVGLREKRTGRRQARGGDTTEASRPRYAMLARRCRDKRNAVGFYGLARPARPPRGRLKRRAARRPHTALRAETPDECGPVRAIARKLKSERTTLATLDRAGPRQHESRACWCGAARGRWHGAQAEATGLLAGVLGEVRTTRTPAR